MKNKKIYIIKTAIILAFLLALVSACSKINLDTPKKDEMFYETEIEKKYWAMVNFSDYNETSPYTPDEYITVFFFSADIEGYEETGKIFTEEKEVIVEKTLQKDFGVDVNHLRLSKFYNPDKKTYTLPTNEDTEAINLYFNMVEAKKEDNKLVCNYIFSDKQGGIKYNIVYEYSFLGEKITSTKTVSIKEEL